MKLYYNPMSTNCLRVVATIHALGLPVELKSTEWDEVESPKFLKMNPTGRLPFLEDGAFYLWESNAIMQYLAEKKTKTELWPENSQARADISRWQCWSLAHLGPPAGTFIWENLLKKMMDAGAPDAKELAVATEEFKEHATLLNNHLQGRKFLVGETATLADFTVGSLVVYADQAKMPITEFKNIRDWYTRLSGLDAWKKALPQH